MPTTAFRGMNPPTTADEPGGHNGGDCEICGDRADGFDAETGRGLCAECAAKPLADRRDPAGVRDA
ncbi:hypothetical protein [Halorubrum sp. DM2]|uniref:hypothetical protein n=1 Tax=Halorubrum sp. DM2 TaxID=2527867 RepID=UPI0024B6F777|nr:hypothetical protein [Halorubrum sp. DM2]